MNDVFVHKAQPTGDQEIPSLRITANGQMPVGIAADETRATFARDGRALAEALWASLPGGTLDHLIGELLADRATLFRVPMPKPPRVVGAGHSPQEAARDAILAFPWHNFGLDDVGQADPEFAGRLAERVVAALESGGAS